MKPDCLYIGLGGNLPESEAALYQAIKRLNIAFQFRSISSLYLTAPQDYPDQAPFLNLVGAWELPAATPPLACLDILLAIETDLGRVRPANISKGPRIIDLDLLLAGEAVLNSPRLILPHPRMQQRRFVLEPLLEIAPDLSPPNSDYSYRNLLAASSDQAIYSKTPLKYTDLSV